MEEINLYDLLRFYAKKWLTIVSAALLGVLIGVIYTFYIQQPTYKSSATVLLVGTNRTSASQEPVVLNNYMELFTSRRVLDPVIAKENYDKGYDQLLASTTAENAKDTDIITFSISTSKAKTSKALLEEAIQEFGKQAKELYGDNSVRISTVDAANLPDSPSNVKPVQQIGIATVGMMALVIIALFFVYDYRHSEIKRTASQTITGKRSKKSVKKSKDTPAQPKNSLGKTVADLLIGDTKNNK